MSKQFRPFYLIIASAVWVLQIFTQAYGQDVIATIKVEERLPQTVQITGKLTGAGRQKYGRNLSFLLDYAGITGLGTRFSDVRLFDDAGRAVPVRRMMDGEYLAGSDYSGFAYKVAVGIPSRAAAASHLSWIDGETGVLMLADLFPQSGGDAKVVAEVKFDLPPAWRAFSSEVAKGESAYATPDLSKSVFFVGRAWRGRAVEGIPLSLAITGERHFTDEEAAAMIREVYGEYKKLFGGHPGAKVQVAIGSPTGSPRTGEWYAETRGTTVTIMSNDMPFRTQSLQRLHEQLRHELFHLWIPNGLSLKGNYDWFYEGFGLYESLKVGVKLNRIRFEDLLDTLSRAYRFDDAIPPKMSLVDASENRWSGGNDRVYARGMLVAFLCDVALLGKSKGRRSIEDIFVKLTDDGTSAGSSDANVTVLRLLRSYPELIPTIDRYITGKEPISWAPELKTVGLETGESGLSVTPKPTAAQRALLNKLGYNNWRKLSPDHK